MTRENMNRENMNVESAEVDLTCVTQYAVFEGTQILRISKNKEEIREYILSFTKDEQIKLTVKCQYQGHWINYYFTRG